MAKKIRELLALYDITEQDLELIRAFGAVVRRRLPDHVAAFYEWLELQPEFREHFSDARVLERVKGQQLTYWTQFLDAKLDDEYPTRNRAEGRGAEHRYAARSRRRNVGLHGGGVATDA